MKRSIENLGINLSKWNQCASKFENWHARLKLKKNFTTFTHDSIHHEIYFRKFKIESYNILFLIVSRLTLNWSLNWHWFFVLVPRLLNWYIKFSSWTTRFSSWTTRQSRTRTHMTFLFSRIHRHMSNFKK